MSQATQTRRRTEGPHAPRLRLIVPQIARRRVPTPFIVVAILLLGLFGSLVANIYIAHTSFKAEELQKTNTRLVEDRNRLSEDISYRSSPQNIERAAKAQGLVRDVNPRYLYLSTGEVEQNPVVPPVADRTTKVPGPRADTREDVRPNLRSNDRLPAVGTDDSDLPAPAIRNPR
ncbi:hypothetical protein NQ036_02040 [Brevibacterium sp. 91QC2O2]|jgi:hypothetical protein|uniref:hypothetical protein n=1 Tax=Brevibacterium TaxID=1696 RepID=UPI00211B793E|nr:MULTISPECIES: hypothetical protein [unclassified Brevibacterium]MCQ9367027.1 hypothetical protein [Brevibacterium sp. 91QC2O2]MCQ9384176.1 hypothetical protein [Brevibacterium sp. 68QC2CO]